MTLSLTENMFWVFLQLHWKLWALYHKKTVIWFYCCKMRCLKLHSIQNMFCLVNNNIELPWAIYRKKKAFLIFLFFVAETRWNQLYKRKSIFWFVCRKIVLLPALLHLGKIFFQFAAKLPWVLLHFTQNNVFTCVWLSDAVLESSFWEQPLPLFS